jgi:type IX secretion system substrate protein/peptidase C25-like protein
MKIFKPVFWAFIFSLLFHSTCKGQIKADTLRTVKMSALADDQSTSLTIQWADDPDANTYSLYRKLVQDTTWGAPLLISGDQDASYLDTDIEEGNLYEYQIVKVTGDTLGYGYLLSGVNYIAPQKKGDILLVVDSIAAAVVEDNLNTYKDILISEGWIPWVATVSEDTSVQEIKSLILQYYLDVDSLTTVVLIGDIAIPHSGCVYPDNHINHKGAWPADVYYGDMDGVWTDETVDYSASVYPRVHNVPGDGKFDQDYIPGKLELAVGRLDFSELPVFDQNEYELLDNYLQKNIEFRTGQYQAGRQALFRNVSPWAEGLGQNAIRNFVPICSNDSIAYDEILDAFDNPYLWSYFGSSGSMYAAYLLGDINTFAENNFQATFTAFFGSTYGDYDHENNFLRTVLASGKVLSTAWVGAPNWYFHPMGMGLDLGYCTLLTQNNVETYYPGLFAQYVTINLLGDPTLKAFIVRPPSDLNVTQIGNHIELNWSPSEDDILGYQVYKRLETTDYFEAINLEPLTNTNFIDTCVSGETQIQYLVKAVKREITPSGSFINYSTGPIVSIQTNPAILPEADFNLEWEQGTLSVTNLSVNADQYQWILPDGTSSFEEIFEIPYNQSGEISVTLIASNDCFSDTLQQTIIITDVVSLVSNEDIRVFPNPAQHFVRIETSKHIDLLQMYDASGNQIMTKSNLVSGIHEFNMQNMAEGIYLLKAHINDQVIPKIIVLYK